jgi:hypothetical protein
MIVEAEKRSLFLDFASGIAFYSNLGINPNEGSRFRGGDSAKIEERPHGKRPDHTHTAEIYGKNLLAFR